MKRHDHFDDLREGDLELLIQRFDRDNDGQISINEVSKINCIQLTTTFYVTVLRINQALVSPAILQGGQRLKERCNREMNM